MFREFGYEEFDGINYDEFRVSVWELWKQTATQIEGISTGQRWPHKTVKRARGNSQGWKPVDPDWMLLTYNNVASGEHDETCFAMLSNKRAQEIWVGLSTRPYRNDELRELIIENAEALADIVIDEQLEVIQFPLNWLVGRKTLPEDHKKAVSATYPSTHEDLMQSFTNRKGMQNDGANRFVFGYRVDASNPLEDSVAKLLRLQDIFETEEGPKLVAPLQ